MSDQGNRSECVTEGIRIRVESQYLEDRSSPREGRWIFAYTITIRNEGAETVQLMSRHWIITDSDGHEEQVRGPGVVGEQPILAPGDAHTYTSFCPLGSSFGTMHGSFQMQTEAGRGFDAEISPFALCEPFAVN